MIDIKEAPESMFAVAKTNECKGCWFENYASCSDAGRDCMAEDREDGENVIFLFDYTYTKDNKEVQDD